MNRKIKFLGWLLIAYAIFPILLNIAREILIPSPPQGTSIPLMHPAILRHFSIPEILGLLYTISIIINGLLNLGVLIGGIALLKLKKWSRKLILIIFSTEVLLQIAWLSVSLYYPYFRKIMFLHKLGVVIMSFYFIFAILMLYTFSKNDLIIAKQSR
ncbi:MAG: hypothetical protein JXA50_09440 [Deltaproteobacteria bacterium]|nr:hypothetical protein [Deltaproteobacteria bacterium]